jgi:glycosyltransferase involved in cell wall biosynthesis
VTAPSQSSASKPKVSVVIPCYYSEKTIAKVVTLTREELVRLGYEYEFVLVNDGSTDGTFPEIRRLCEADANVKGIDLIRNFGQHGAIMAGLSQTSGDLVLLMDDDMQTHPSQIGILLDKIYEGYDVVFADYGKSGMKESLFRRLGSRLAGWSSRVLAGRPKDVYVSSFLVMRDYIRDSVLRYVGPYPYVEGLIFRSTNRVVSVPVKHYEREVGTSGYSLHALVRLWSSIACLSIKPLRLAIVIGSIMSTVGIIWAIVIVIQRLCGYVTVLGWSSLMATMLFCFGAVIMFLGLIGEYIGRMSLTVDGALQYGIRTTVNINGENSESKDGDDPDRGLRDQGRAIPQSRPLARPSPPPSRQSSQEDSGSEAPHPSM